MKLYMTENKVLTLDSENEKIFIGENGTAELNIAITGEFINELVDITTCAVALKVQLTDESILTYPLSLKETGAQPFSGKKQYTAAVGVTLDITDTAGTVKIFLVMTKDGGVVGKTNAVDLAILDSPDGTDATPRAELIAEIEADNEDFTSIREAIIDKGVEVPENTPTSQYADKIEQISSGGGDEEFAAFIGRSGTSVVVPAEVGEIAGYSFYMWDGLEEVDLSNCNNLETISDHAFDGCIALYSINIPDTVEAIGEFAFHGCSQLGNINIPNILESIEESAFEGCALQSVVIPSSVTNIGPNAFKDCIHLTDVYYTGTETEWGDIYIEENAFPAGVTMHYEYSPS